MITAIEMKVRLTTTEEMLGTASNDKEIHERFIASNAPDAPTREEEISAVGVEELIERSMTVFPRGKDGKPILWDYQLKGFFKDACGVLRKVSKSKSSACKAYKKEIDGNIFVCERQIQIQFDGDITTCQRPLRAQTAQGERVALASSEAIPAGATMEFTVLCLEKSDMPLVKEWLNYGKWRGLCQWRNSGKGRFTWENLGEREVEVDL